MKNKYFRQMAVLLCCLFASMAVWAAPNMIRFQGRLTDNQGAPIVGPDVSVKFSLYSLASGGNLLWDAGAEQLVATNSAGLFSTDIGPVPINVFSDNNDLYLQVAVRGPAGLKSLSPRQKLSSVPYAFQANFTTYAVNSATAAFAQTVADDSITTSKIKDGEVTANDLASNSVGSRHIIDGSIQSVDLATGAVGNMQIADQSITANKIDRNSLINDGIALPYGSILIFLSTCPSGYSPLLNLQNRFPIGADLQSVDPDIPDRPNQPVGSKTHSHSIVHTHETGIQENYTGYEEIGTGQDYVYFSHPKLLSGVAALAGADYVAAKGYDHTHPTVSQSTTTSGVAITLPPAITVNFCEKIYYHPADQSLK